MVFEGKAGEKVGAHAELARASETFVDNETAKGRIEAKRQGGQMEASVTEHVSAPFLPSLVPSP